MRLREVGFVKRTGTVLGVLIVGIALLVWAGVNNYKERKLATQKAQESRVVLAPKADTGDDATGLEPKMKGKVAPAFSLVDLSGKKVSLADYKGKAVLVNFWATWCGPCKVEMPWFEEFRAKYASQGFEILGLADDVDAGKDVIEKTAKKTGATYPILLTDGKVQKAYGGLEVLPVSFYIDKKGVIVEQTAGLGPKDEIEANIKKTIASGGVASLGGAK